MFRRSKNRNRTAGKVWSSILLCAAAVLADGSATPSAAQRPSAPAPCSARDLPGLGGLFGEVTGANVAGDMVGVVLGATGKQHAVLWHAGVPQDIVAEAESPRPIAITSDGLIVGVGRTAEGPVGWYRLQNRVSVLRTVGEGIAEPTAVSDAGVVVGALTENQLDEEDEGTEADAQGEDERAVVWRSPQALPQVLPPLRGDQGARALAVDASGRVAGVSEGAAFTPVIWERDGTARALPTLGGGYAAVRGFGPGGVMVGDAVGPDGIDRAVLWTADHRITTLAMPPGMRGAQARNMLADGTVLGSAQWTDGSSHAIRWESSGRAARLDQDTAGTRGESGGAVRGSSVTAAAGRSVFAGSRWDADGGRHPVMWRCEG